MGAVARRSVALAKGVRVSVVPPLQPAAQQQKRHMAGGIDRVAVPPPGGWQGADKIARHYFPEDWQRAYHQ